MVCEQQDLIGLAELGKQVELRPSALVIEMHQNIVRDEGQRLRRTGVPATKGDLALPGLCLHHLPQYRAIQTMSVW